MEDHELAAELLQNHFTATAALIALISLLASCSDTRRDDPLAGALRASDVDSQIVQAAAIDFLENGRCWEGSGKSGIVVIDETLGSDFVFFWLRLNDLPSDTWKTDLESGLPNLRMRNQRAEPIDWHFTNQDTIHDVVVQGETGGAINKAAALGNCVTTFALPGIYAEGQRATVVFSIQPEYHGRLHMSSLHLVHGVWQVERRQNFEYN